MVADAEISPQEAARQASIDHLAISLPAEPKPSAAPAEAPAFGSTPLPTLEQFLKKQEEEKKAAARTDNSFLQMNASTADLEDLLGALTAAAPPSASAAPATAKPLDVVATAAADSVRWAPTDDKELLGLSFLQLKDPETEPTAPASAAALLRRAAARAGVGSLRRLADSVENAPDPAALLQQVAAGFCAGAKEPRPSAPAVPALLLQARNASAAWAALAEKTRAWGVAAHTGDAGTDALIDDYVAQAQAEALWVKQTAAEPTTLPPAPAPVSCRVTPASTAVTAALLVLKQPPESSS